MPLFTVMARLVRATHEHLIHPVCMGPPHYASLQRGMTAILLAALVCGSAVPVHAQTPDQPAPPTIAPPDPTAQPSPPPTDQTVAPPAPVQAQALTPLDIFSTGRDTGLGPDLWKGSSADLARAIIPSLADHPLSPAGQALARRVLGATAQAPDGAGSDADLAAARAGALLATGDAADAGLILDHTSGLANSPALSQTAAEAALINDQADKACAIGDALAIERGGGYWLKLRAFCQARAGKPSAQLTASLAENADKDPVFDRMISVIINSAGDPGPASLANGLNYAMSRQLKLDLSPAIPGAAPAIAARLAADQAGLGPAAPAAAPLAEADVLAGLRQAKDPAAYAAASHLALPAIVELVQAKTPLTNPVQLAAAALAGGDPATAAAIRQTLTGDAVPGADATDLAILDAALSAAANKPDGPTLDRLIERGGQSDPRAAGRAQAAAALGFALGWPADGAARAAFASFGLGRGDATPARLLLLDAAADAGLRGDTALVALSIAELGAAAGPAPADRARVIRALARAGLAPDAGVFAVEGLLALESR